MTLKIKDVTIECTDGMAIEVEGDIVRVKPSPSYFPHFIPVPYPVERQIVPLGPVWITTQPEWRYNQITCASTGAIS